MFLSILISYRKNVSTPIGFQVYLYLLAQFAEAVEYADFIST